MDSLKSQKIRELHAAYMTLDQQAESERGFSFEKVVVELLDYEGLQPTGSHRAKTDEQIDCSFKFEGRLYLVETKYLSRKVKYADLIGFISKVEHWFAHPIGIVISPSGFSSDLPEKLVSPQASLQLILFTGADLEAVFSQAYTFLDLLRIKLQAAEERKIPLLEVKDFTNYKKEELRHVRFTSAYVSLVDTCRRQVLNEIQTTVRHKYIPTLYTPRAIQSSIKDFLDVDALSDQFARIMKADRLSFAGRKPLGDLYCTDFCKVLHSSRVFRRRAHDGLSAVSSQDQVFLRQAANMMRPAFVLIDKAG
jgi:hypothetical protein